MGKVQTPTVMKVSGNSLRPGNVILHASRMWVVVKAQHTQPGKGGAYMCVVLRDIQGSTKKDERFRAAEDVERVFIEEHLCEFLYKDGEFFVFMDPETYEQFSVQEALLNAPASFLAAGMMATVGFHEQTPVFVTLPTQVVLTVEEAAPAIKGQTAASSYKPAVLCNGVKTMVPPYIETGTQVIIHTEDGSYVERYKAP
jgi:elongation factor P